MALAPAGWYPDPSGAARLRYFDGSRWTDYFSDDRPSHGARSDDKGATTQRHPAVRRPLLFLILAIVGFLMAVAGFAKLISSGDSEIYIVGLPLFVGAGIVGTVISANVRAAKPAVRRTLVFLILAIVGYLIAVAAFVLQVKVSYFFGAILSTPACFSLPSGSLAPSSARL